MIGQTLAHYRIEEKLGEGGMGTVYRAEDTSLDRPVALKVLPDDMARDQERFARFRQEAKTVAALNHPNIVTIYSVEKAEGSHFITMEYVRGRTFSEVIPPHGLQFQQLLTFALPLADAVAAAHEAGITHRDLKPANVLVSASDQLKVLDFGLAKRHDVAADAESGTDAPTLPLTQEGHILGTVSYMAPEQAEGRSVDARSDVFTLGIMLYEMATGERPFQGDTPMSILSSVIKDDPKPLDEANPSLPRAFTRIVNRCLAKDPSKRFQSALGLKNELRTLKEESDSGKLVTSVRAEAPPSASRSRAILYAALVIAFFALLAGVFYFTRSKEEAAMETQFSVGVPDIPDIQIDGITEALEQAKEAIRKSIPEAAVAQTDHQKKLVVLPFDNLGPAEDEFFAAGMTEEITSRLASVQGLAVISRTSAIQYDKTGKTMRQIGEELGVGYVLEGSVRWDRRSDGSSRVRITPQLIRVADDTQLWSDRYDRVLEDVFAVQSEIADQVLQELDVALRHPGQQLSKERPTDNLDAYQAYLRALENIEDPSETPEKMHRAIELFEQAVQLDPDFATAWAELSKTHSNLYHSGIDQTEERLVKARGCADTAIKLQPDLPSSRIALGYYYYWGRKDYERALNEFSRVPEGQENNADVLAAVGYIRRRQGRWAEALANMEKAFELNPRSVELASNIGQAYASLRQYVEADRYFDIAISLAPEAGIQAIKAFNYIPWKGNTETTRDIMEKMPPVDHPYWNFGWMYLNLLEQRYEDALEHIEAIPVDLIETQGFFGPKSLYAGIIYRHMDKSEQARTACGEALNVLQSELPQRSGDPRVRVALSLAYACLGRKDEAIREAKLATDMYPVSRDAALGPDYEMNLATIYAIVGEDDAALEKLEYLLSIPAGPSIQGIKLQPNWKPLTNHPRFRELERRYSSSE